MKIYLNNQLMDEAIAKIDISDRGLLLGDGLFETIKATNGHLHSFKKHISRLKESSDFFGIPFNNSNEANLAANCKQLLIENNLINTLATIRITLTRGPATRGIGIPVNMEPTLLITATPFVLQSNIYPTACITQIKKNEYSPLIHHKTLNYLESILARKEAQTRGYDIGIMLNTKGFITECCVANIFFVKNNQVITPRLIDGIFPGITRNAVINICQIVQIPIIEKQIHPFELINITEAFQTNSLIGIQSIKQIDNKPIDIGAITNIIQHNYNELVDKSITRYNDVPIK